MVTLKKEPHHAKTHPHDFWRCYCQKNKRSIPLIQELEFRIQQLTIITDKKEEGIRDTSFILDEHLTMFIDLEMLRRSIFLYELDMKKE